MVCVVTSGVSVATGTVTAGAAAALSIGAVVVAGAVAVAVTNYAANAAARGMSKLGETLEQRGRDQLDNEENLRAWHMAAVDVVGLNATLRVLRRRADALGVDVTLPKPMNLAYAKLPDIVAWSRGAGPVIEAARAVLADKAMAADWHRLAAALPVTPNGGPDLSEAMANYRALLRDHRLGDAQPVHPPAIDDRVDIEAEVTAALANLVPDAFDADRHAVLLAAANATVQRDPADARAFLMALRRRVNEANRRELNRDQAARWLGAMEQPVLRTVTMPQNVPLQETIAELLSVVDGHRDLDAGLRAQVGRVLSWAQRVAQLQYRRESLAAQLRERGYEITVVPGDGTVAALRATRAGWHGEHVADVWFDTELNAHVQLLREVDAIGDDARLRDADRTEALAEDIDKALHELSHAGFTDIGLYTHRTQHRNAPGTGAQETTERYTPPSVRHHTHP